MKTQLIYFFAAAILFGVLLYSPLLRRDSGRNIAHTAVDKIANKTGKAAQNTRDFIARKTSDAASGISRKANNYASGGAYAGGGSYAGAASVGGNAGGDAGYSQYISYPTVAYSNNPKHYASQDLRLSDNNIRKLAGMSSANISIYNKGIFYEGYKDMELKVISYDEEGNYLGHRYEIFRNEICEGETLKERLEIPRGTDEIVAYIVKATPTNCFDQGAFDRQLERENRLAEKNQRKEDRKTGRTKVEKSSTEVGYDENRGDPDRRRLSDRDYRKEYDRNFEEDHNHKKDKSGPCHSCLDKPTRKYRKAQEKADRYKEEINRYCLSCKTWE